MVETRHLRLIKAIVEKGGITRAMNVLHLTQSALSCQLKEAESSIGTQLFYRHNKKLTLTPAGKKLYLAAERILKDIAETEQEITGLLNGDRGIIRISADCYSSYIWLPQLVDKFIKDFPQIEVEITFERTRQPIDGIVDDELDLAITSTPSQVDCAEYIPFFKDELYAVMSNEHIWKEKEYIDPNDFKEATLIVQSLPVDNLSIFKNLLSPRAIYPKKVIYVPLTEAAIEVIMANMGVLLLPGWALAPYLKDNIKVLKITSIGFFRQHYLTKIRNRKAPLFIDYFIEYLRKGISLDNHYSPKIIPFPYPKAKLSLTKN